MDETKFPNSYYPKAPPRLNDAQLDDGLATIPHGIELTLTVAEAKARARERDAAIARAEKAEAQVKTLTTCLYDYADGGTCLTGDRQRQPCRYCQNAAELEVQR